MAHTDSPHMNTGSYDVTGRKTVVIGQGYVGLPLSLAATHAGFAVVGLDKSQRVVDLLNDGKSHVDDIQDQEVAEILNFGFRASSDPEVLREAEVVVICVPTPLAKDGTPDLDPVVDAARTIARHLRKGATVVLESTTYPGTTDGLVKDIFTAAGHRIDEDYFLAFSPERIDPGNAVYTLTNTPKVVGGVTEESTAKAKAFYASFIDKVVTARGAKEAETAKLLENTYRHINIALVNEMAKFCHEMDIDLWDVIDAAKTKPFGFQAFYPGPGVGGHCIPIDPNYLSYEVKRTLGYPFRFVELAQEINQSMPSYTVQRVQEALNDDKLALNGAEVLILGVTYKPNIADQRESPAFDVAVELLKRGAVLKFHDPKVDTWHLPSGDLPCVPDLEEAVREADISILLQNHAEYDVQDLAAQAKRFFDTRGAIAPGTGTRL